MSCGLYVVCGVGYTLCVVGCAVVSGEWCVMPEQLLEVLVLVVSFRLQWRHDTRPSLDRRHTYIHVSREEREMSDVCAQKLKKKPFDEGLKLLSKYDGFKKCHVE